MLKIRNDYAYLLMLALNAIPTNKLSKVAALRSCNSITDKVEETIAPFIKDYTDFVDIRASVRDKFQAQDEEKEWKKFFNDSVKEDVKRMNNLSEIEVEIELSNDDITFLRVNWEDYIAPQLPSVTPRDAAVFFVEAFGVE